MSNKRAIKPQVIIRECDNYDPEKIRKIIREGLEELDLSPYGNTLVKPNLVAAGEQFPHAYTRVEFMEGVLQGLQDRASQVGEQPKEIAVGEKSGITIPTRFAFKESGYDKLLKRLKVKKYNFEETPQVEIPLYHKGRLRDNFFTPEPIAKADFFVNCPKFKAHPWTTVTFSMKNYIGIQDDRHRLIDHDHKLNEKVADLQYIIQPQFIAIDAIIAGEGRMLTPMPFEMGLIIMGNNQVAFDSVCCKLIGLNPLEIEHIKLAHKRGFGPVDMAKIKVTGDISLTAAKKKAKGFKTGLIRVEEYFKGSNIKAYAGAPPGGKVSEKTKKAKNKKHLDSEKDYCWGGCPGALEEAIEILRIYDSQTDEKMPPLHIVFGSYEGDIDAKDGEKVLFIGDCTEFHGIVNGKYVDINSVYVDRSELNPHEAKHQDIFKKILSVEKNLWLNRKKDILRINGCPVSVAEQTLALVKLAKLKNPYFDKSTAPKFISTYFSWRTHNALQRMLGVSYQKLGATYRGQSRPKQNLPSKNDSHELEISSLEK